MHRTVNLFNIRVGKSTANVLVVFNWLFLKGMKVSTNRFEKFVTPELEIINYRVYNLVIFCQ